MTDLNERQQLAVKSKAKIRVIIAGAGSGKTRTLVRAVLECADSGVAEGSIAVLTFTNGGAHEFTERLKPLKLGYSGTRHGFMFRLLQRFGSKIGYKEGTISLIPNGAAEQLLSQTAVKLGMSTLSNKKLKQMRDHKMFPEAGLVWREFYHTLKRNNLVDFDKVLEDGLRILQSDVDAGIEALFCDEKQDDSFLDWQIDGAIGAKSEFYVGDPDQSIYVFRQGRPDILIDAADKNACFTLNLNYRSGKEICEAANRLIAHNTNRIKKDLVPADPFPCVVEAHTFKTEREELAFVLGAVDPEKPNETAVLARTQALAKTVRGALLLAGIKVKEAGVVEVPDDWSKALTLVSLLLNPTNDVLAERFMRMTMDDAQVNDIKLRLLADNKRVSDWTFGGRFGPDLFDLPEGVFSVPQKLAQLGVSESSVLLIEERIEVLPQNPPLLADLVHDLFNHESWNRDSEGVTVSTMHGAKGKQWEDVIIFGCDQGLLPDRRCDVEEERRLMFVAVTRAKRRLAVTNSRTRPTPWGKIVENESSQFIAELMP